MLTSIVCRCRWHHLPIPFVPLSWLSRFKSATLRVAGTMRCLCQWFSANMLSRKHGQKVFVYVAFCSSSEGGCRLCFSRMGEVLKPTVPIRALSRLMQYTLHHYSVFTYDSYAGIIAITDMMVTCSSIRITVQQNVSFTALSTASPLTFLCCSTRRRGCRSVFRLTGWGTGQLLLPGILCSPGGTSKMVESFIASLNISVHQTYGAGTSLMQPERAYFHDNIGAQTCE